MNPMPAPEDAVVDVRGVMTRFGEHVVHDGIELQVRRAEIFAVVGGSGSGKSTLLRELILLHKPDAGSIRVLGSDLATLDTEGRRALRARWGVMFQHGGLFSSLNILENLGLPLREHTGKTDAEVNDMARAKLELVGLKPEVATQFPGELSGGMMKRASLARAIALDPELLFLDEPTAGLDPQSADGVDELVLRLREESGLSIVMITHDLDLLWQVADRVAVLADGRVRGVGSMTELSHLDSPAVQPYFSGPRGRAAQSQQQVNQAGEPGSSVSKPR
jgi:phospholipid/cholesterol/gamma-HCH transport system ATP-binding protein